ncbi:MAG TPA: 2-keto-3-deoxy-galactonokinase, partial [Thalassospira sp.]|nr:2-keto-3-deoxy-galactonokinase [Thalassospira sp.]
MGDLSWIAVDWGTSNLRVWGLDDSGNILGTVESPLGMNAIASDPKLSFETVLVGLIEDWLAADAAKLPVVICGMAGAKQGWLEAPYCDVPARPSDLA